MHIKSLKFRSSYGCLEISSSFLLTMVGHFHPKPLLIIPLSPNPRSNGWRGKVNSLKGTSKVYMPLSELSLLTNIKESKETKGDQAK